MARSDGRFDVVTLRFGVLPQHAARDAVARIDAELATFPDDMLRVCWAHMSLRMVDWAIRHFTNREVDAWTQLAVSRMA